ncbi:hypothetical protein PPHE_a1000 [Pseudoalteromonas phenolica O-BC30]|nr:hypothetical protein [Pseudoalteromonas phenolica O-BC30]
MALFVPHKFSQLLLAGYNGVMRHLKPLSLMQFSLQVFSSNQLLGTVV